MIVRMKYESKQKAFAIIITNLLFIVMWVVDAFYVQTNFDYGSDYREYYNVYNGIKENYFEIGYYYAGIIARSIGINFFVFRLIIVTITLGLMRNSILRYSKEPVLVTVIYMFHPFLLQCIQIRNALTMAIIIYALRYLDKDNYKPWKYILCILISTLFHTSSLLYGIIILCVLMKPNRIVKISIIFLISMEIAMLFFKQSIVFFLADFLKVSKISYYFNNNETRIFTLSMVAYLGIYILCVQTFRKYGNRFFNDCIDSVLLLSSILVLTYIPLMLVHYDYFRIYEYFLPVITMGLFNYLHSYGSGRRLYKLSIKGVFILIAIFKCMTWVIDNNNEVLGNIMLLK